MNEECKTCIKRKTVYCPNSIECMAADDKPYYQNRIMLLEENKQLKEEVEEYKNPIKYFKYANKNVTNENEKLKDNWIKLKEFIRKAYYMYLPLEASTKSITILLDKMQVLEEGDK